MAELIFRHVWPTIDPDDETEATFRVMFQAIPQQIKTLWGWTEDDNERDQEAIALEYDRLADYTRKPERKPQISNDDDF